MALSKWGMYFVLCNLLVGGGILAIPKAFEEAGILVSFIILLIVALINWLLHRELLEITEEFSLPPSPNEHLLDPDRQLKSPHQWDLPEIVRRIMGPKYYVIYFSFFALYVVIGVAAYFSLFRQTTGAIFGCDTDLKDASAEGCKEIYHLGNLVFLVVIGGLTVLDYEKQIWVHRTMVIIQFILTVLIVIFSIDFYRSRTYEPNKRIIPSEPKYFIYTFQVIMYACWYLTATPSVLASSAKHHKSQKLVAFWMFASSLAIYGVVGCTTGVFLVDIFYSSISFYDLYLTAQQSSLLTAILVIPALDIITNSPIVCQTLSGAVFTALYGTNHKLERLNHPRIHLLLRLGSVIPSFIFASIIPKFVSFR